MIVSVPHPFWKTKVLFPGEPVIVSLPAPPLMIVGSEMGRVESMTILSLSADPVMVTWLVADWACCTTMVGVPPRLSTIWRVLAAGSSLSRTVRSTANPPAV